MSITSRDGYLWYSWKMKSNWWLTFSKMMSCYNFSINDFQTIDVHQFLPIHHDYQSYNHLDLFHPIIQFHLNNNNNNNRFFYLNIISIPTAGKISLLLLFVVLIKLFIGILCLVFCKWSFERILWAFNDDAVSKCRPCDRWRCLENYYLS